MLPAFDQRHPISESAHSGGNSAAAAPTVDAMACHAFPGQQRQQAEERSRHSDDDPEQWTVTHESGDPADTVTSRHSAQPESRRRQEDRCHAPMALTLRLPTAFCGRRPEGGIGDDQLTMRNRCATAAGGGGNDRLTVGPGAKNSERTRSWRRHPHGGCQHKLYGDAGNDALLPARRSTPSMAATATTSNRWVTTPCLAANNDVISWHTATPALH